MGNSTQKEHFNNSGKTNHAVHEAHRNWMENLPDDLLLINLSIPGTHNSAAEYPDKLAPVKCLAACQSKCILHQLRIGIRFLDIRCSNYKNQNRFDIFHGFVDMERSFGQVLDHIRDFLQEVPSETVIMRLRVKEHDNKNGTDAENLAIFTAYLNEYPNLFYQFLPDEQIPLQDQLNRLRLGDVRGRIVLLQPHPFNFGSYPRWTTHLTVEDAYEAYGKAKEASINQGLSAFQTRTRLTITFASSAFRTSYRIQISAKENNLFVFNRLKQVEGTGVIVFDYPGDALIHRVIEKNTTVQS